MNKNDKYVTEVFKFGGDEPYIDENGQSRNLNQNTSFAECDVITDGEGNITDMPLLVRKLCFGRPERFFRETACIGETVYIPQMCRIGDAWNKCANCPVFEACAKVSLERIESDPSIEQALGLWQIESDNRVGKAKFRSTTSIKLWARFLHAIKEHGGWMSVNDARAAVDSIVRKEDRDEKRRQGQRKTRQNERARRMALNPTMQKPADFGLLVEAERKRRLQILLDLRVQNFSPKWISKLTPDGCRLVVAVWAAFTNGSNNSQAATAKDVVFILSKQGYGSNKTPESLRTSIYRSIKRINMLEDDRAGNAIWSKFL